MSFPNGAIHISTSTAPPAEVERFRSLSEDDEDYYGACCEGAAMMGIDHCTCWEPIFDLEQAPVVESDVVSSPGMAP